jgi:hypothetical protein
MPKREAPYELSAKEFAADLKFFLDSVPAISNIVITCKNEDAKVQIKSPSHKFLDSFAFPPFASNVKLSFQLYIPARVQEELLRPLRMRVLSNPCETFQIYVQPEYHAPVTFVEPLHAKKPFRPARSVVIVREYLKKHAPKDNVHIEFDSLGPSPFHAHFYLAPQKRRSKSNEHLFNVNLIETRGYDHIFITYAPQDFLDFDQVKWRFISNAADELNVFYATRIRQSKAIDLWHKVQKELDQVIENDNTKPTVKLLRSFRRGKHLKLLFSKIAELESLTIRLTEFVSFAFARIYVKHEENLFQPILQKEINRMPKFPIKPIIELASFLEERRGRSMEMLAVIISALIGGIIGSIITLLFSKVS